MKKSLITLFAVAGLASGATMSLDIVADGTNNGGHGSTNATAALTNYANSADGGYMFNSGGVVNPDTSFNEGILRTENGEIVLSMAPRTGAGGSGEAIVISGNELNDLTVTSLTFSIASSECTASTDIAMTLAVITTTNGTNWTVYDMDTDAITLNSAGEVTLDLDESITWSDSYKVVAMVDNTAKTITGGNSPVYTLKGISVTAEYASVPEPATASLSLLGLAALMIRRRR